MKESGTDPDLIVNHCILDVKAMKSRNYDPNGFRGTGGYMREPKNNFTPPNDFDDIDAYIFVRVTNSRRRLVQKVELNFRVKMLQQTW